MTQDRTNDPRQKWGVGRLLAAILADLEHLETFIENAGVGNGFISPIKFGDTASIDAFARARVSNPYTVFDSKQVTNDQEDLFWDDAEVSGGSTASNYSNARASTALTVALNTAGRRVRQTKRRFNYQPGKSMLAFITSVPIYEGGGDGIRIGIGMYDDGNGIFFQHEDGVAQMVLRSSASGAMVDTTITQADWNMDRMDGSGASGINLDFTKSQILLIDYEWLGVGRVRVGWVIDGIPYYCHEFLNTNVLDVVYMSTPNLPIRYEIENDGTGVKSTVETICSAVISEGGVEPNGVVRSDGTKHLTANVNTSGTYYALLGIRLKAASLGSDITLERVKMAIASVGDAGYWEIRLNPTVAGTFNYSDLADSVVQTAVGDTTNNPSTNTVTGGTVLEAGYVTTNSITNLNLKEAVKLGATIAGVRDEIVLCVSPITGDNNLDVAGGMIWREIA